MCARLQRGIAVAAVVIAIGVAGQVQAQWSLSWLDHLPGDEDCYVASISAGSGTVVGSSSYGEYHDDLQTEAFRWTPTEGTVGLGFLPGHAFSNAQDVSADGSVVVGYSQAEIGEVWQGEAFRWTPAGGVAGLGFLPGDDHSSAHAVTADGSVVVGGSGGNAARARRAFRWTEATGMEDLGCPEGGSESEARLVSDDGSVVMGRWRMPDWHRDAAFRWTEDGGMVDLGSLPGGGLDRALDMSADGSVVLGLSDELGFCLWTEAGGIDTNMYGTRMSEDGLLLLGGDGTTSHLWDSVNGLRNLSELLIAGGLDFGGANPYGREISRNSERLIIAGHVNDLGGAGRSWVATYMIPEPSTLVLLLMGLPVLAAGVRRRRKTQ